MRSAEVLQAVRARFGPSVTALRLSLAGPAPATRRPAPPRAAPPASPRPLDAEERALVDRALEPVHDAALASTVRRVVAKDLIARRGRALVAVVLGGAALAGVLGGCASTATGPAESASLAGSFARRPIGARRERNHRLVAAGATDRGVILARPGTRAGLFRGGPTA